MAGAAAAGRRKRVRCQRTPKRRASLGAASRQPSSRWANAHPTGPKGSASPGQISKGRPGVRSMAAQHLSLAAGPSAEVAPRPEGGQSRAHPLVAESLVVASLVVVAAAAQEAATGRASAGAWPAQRQDLQVSQRCRARSVSWELASAVSALAPACPRRQVCGWHSSRSRQHVAAVEFRTYAIRRWSSQRCGSRP